MYRTGNIRKGGISALFRIAAVAAGMTFLGAQARAEETAQDCVVDPDKPDNAQALTAGRIADCDGVLRPAPTGDRELVEPAPEAGETPVIPPEKLPNQQPGE
mgnify:CR=1 FL=1